MPPGLPQGSVYQPVPDEFIPYGVPNVVNLYPMELPSVSKNQGVFRPMKLWDRGGSTYQPGPIQKIFSGFAAILTPPAKR